ncbi:MAG: cyclic lactone autoinducer peptide [Oscillospiraceae bacterium]
MKTLTKPIEVLGKTVTKLALSMGVKATNSVCHGWYHQPKEPNAMDKF